MKVIFLDDNEERQKKMKSMLPCIKQTYTADETIEAIKENEEIDYLFLDHDLGGEIYVDSKEHNTGMTVAKWIAENEWNISMIIVHSFNPVGAKNMYDEMVGKYNVQMCRFISHEFITLVEGILNEY